jgi:hypothetical protein
MVRQTSIDQVHSSRLCPLYQDGPTAFRASFRSRDKPRHEAILKVDSDAMLIIPALDKADLIATMTRQDVRDWLDTMVTLELKYVHLNTNPIPRFAEVMSAFLKKCDYYDLLSNREWNSMDDEGRKRAWAIGQDIDALEQERKVVKENMALRTDFSSYSFAKALNLSKNAESDLDDSDIVLDIDNILVEPFRYMDSWELIEGMGLVDYQPKEQRALAESLNKDEAHRRLSDSKGRPLKNEDGDWIWKNPDEHHARMNIHFPGLNKLNSEPRNRNEWDSYVDECAMEGTTPIRTEERHEPIYPSVQQPMGVSNIIARNYLDPRYAPHHSHTLMMARWEGDGRAYVVYRQRQS